MSFPAGIVRIFNGSAAPPVLSFRLLNAGAIEQFLPNADLLYRCGDMVTAGIGVQGPWEVGDAVMAGLELGYRVSQGGTDILQAGGCSDGELYFGVHRVLDFMGVGGSWQIQCWELDIGVHGGTCFFGGAWASWELAHAALGAGYRGTWGSWSP